ncbi:MAG: beta-ketoacyl-[acyl-carrier-protein] synthase family protein [Ignavibacteria bacterium]
MKTRVYLSALGIINALGSGTDEVARGLFGGDTSGMVVEEGWLAGAPARVGRVRGALPEVPPQLGDYASRSAQILLAALSQIEAEVETALTRHGRNRVGVVLGASTGGIAEGEAAIALRRANGALPAEYRYVQQEIGTPAVFLARHLGISGPAYTVLTACTSSAKAFASARRLLRHGICDAVLVGGVDALCKLTIAGFTALESTTAELTNPLSRNRRGINIGEGAALFLMSREEAGIELLGVGETSDGYHISAPQPEGLGAEAAMRGALADARTSSDQVDYLNLHATATPKNDEMESRAVSRVFPGCVACSGTKPLTGHMLGAAGATELAFCWLAIRDGRLPPHVWDGEADPDLPVLDLVAGERRFAGDARRVCMSNSFAFGGNNASLLIGGSR